MDLVEAAYAVARTLPAPEAHGLAGRMRRAAVPVAANIAEGHARALGNDFLHFLSFARASLKELETHLLIVTLVGYADARPVREPLEMAEEVSRMLTTTRARPSGQG